MVQARDSFGNLCQSGGDSFSVQIQGVAREAICITDRHDGTYAVEYSVPAEGNYQASVTLDGAHVAGSPAPITAFRSALPAGKEKEKIPPFGVSLMRSQVSYRAAQSLACCCYLIYLMQQELTCSAASELAQAVNWHVVFSHKIYWHAQRYQA